MRQDDYEILTEIGHDLESGVLMFMTQTATRTLPENLVTDPGSLPCVRQ